MKKAFFITPILCFSFCITFAQEASTDTLKREVIISPPPTDDPLKDDEGHVRIFVSVEKEAQFPGGAKAWSEFISSNLSAFDPSKNGAPKGKYTVIVRFIVSRKGKISNIQTETNHGYGMEKEVLKLIKRSPDWIPAHQDGNPVNAYRRQPVTFIVE